MALFKLLNVKKDERTGELKASCPLYKIDVLVTTACANCKYFCGLEESIIENTNSVKCEYRKFEKSSSVYPDEDALVKKRTDITNQSPYLNTNISIAKDTVHRDLHQPSIEELAEWFGLDIDQITG